MSDLILPEHIRRKKPLDLNVRDHGINVVISASYPVQDIVLTAQEAADLSAALTKVAGAVAKKQGKGVPKPRQA